jgi:hypothetical protein
MRFSLLCSTQNQRLRSSIRPRKAGKSKTLVAEAAAGASLLTCLQKASLELKITDLQDWYKITATTFIKTDAGRLIRRQYGLTLHQALKETYKEHKWEDWRFQRVPTGLWKNLDTQRSFFQQLGKVYDIDEESCLEKWYRIDPKIVEQAGGTYSRIRRSIQGIF